MIQPLGASWPCLGPLRRSRLKRLSLAMFLAALVYLFWPYVALWGLSRAVDDPDPAVLADHIDLEAVRDEIRRKLNKDSHSAIGTLSDPFIQWLEQGIRQLGTGALDELVTQEWVRERLTVGSAPDQGLLSRVSYAFFDAPACFAVSLGAPGRGGLGQPQVHLRMHLEGFRWAVSAVYY